MSGFMTFKIKFLKFCNDVKSEGSTVKVYSEGVVVVRKAMVLVGGRMREKSRYLTNNH